MLTTRDAFGTPEQRVEFWRRMTEEVRALPGIVGVSTRSGVPLRSFGLDAEARPMIYYSGFAAPSFNRTFLVWRSAGDPASHTPAVREVIRRINQHAALSAVTSASDMLAMSFGPRRLNTTFRHAER